MYSSLEGRQQQQKRNSVSLSVGAARLQYDRQESSGSENDEVNNNDEVAVPIRRGSKKARIIRRVSKTLDEEEFRSVQMEDAMAAAAAAVAASESEAGASRKPAAVDKKTSSSCCYVMDPIESILKEPLVIYGEDDLKLLQDFMRHKQEEKNEDGSEPSTKITHKKFDTPGAAYEYVDASRKFRAAAAAAIQPEEPNSSVDDMKPETATADNVEKDIKKEQEEPMHISSSWIRPIVATKDAKREAPEKAKGSVSAIKKSSQVAIFEDADEVAKNHDEDEQQASAMAVDGRYGGRSVAASATGEDQDSDTEYPSESSDGEELQDIFAKAYAKDDGKEAVINGDKFQKIVGATLPEDTQHIADIMLGLKQDQNAATMPKTVGTADQHAVDLTDGAIMSSSQSKDMDVSEKPGPYDVLCGKRWEHYSGNVRFRKLVLERSLQMHEQSNNGESLFDLARMVAASVQNHPEHPVRFLKAKTAGRRPGPFCKVDDKEAAWYLHYELLKLRSRKNSDGDTMISSGLLASKRAENAAAIRARGATARKLPGTALHTSKSATSPAAVAADIDALLRARRLAAISASGGLPLLGSRPLTGMLSGFSPAGAALLRSQYANLAPKSTSQALRDPERKVQQPLRRGPNPALTASLRAGGLTKQEIPKPKTGPPSLPPTSSLRPQELQQQHQKKQQQPKVMLPADFTPTPHTVMCGRGKKCQDYIGNQRLKVIAQMFVGRYSEAFRKEDKSVIVSEILEMVHASVPDKSMSFVRFHEGRYWSEDTSAAREKIGTVLRDCLASKYNSSTKSKSKRRREKREAKRVQERAQIEAAKAMQNITDGRYND